MEPTKAQRICIQETFGMPSAVVAGAGSGKTATLTNRIVYALEHPAQSGVDDIGQILAITYTSKAAGELKSRIRSALQEAGLRDARLAEQALKVDGAWIGTIHGMCSRILKENAFSLGIDPAFGILPEDVRGQLRAEAVEEVLTAYADDPRVEALYGEYARDDIAEALEQLAGLAAAHGGSVADSVIMPPQDNAAACLYDLVDYARQLYALLADASGTTAEKWCAGTLSALEDVLGVQGADAALAPLAPQTEARLLDTPPDRALLAASHFPKVNRRLKIFKEAQLDGTDLPPYLAYADCAARLRLAAARPHLDTLVFLAQAVSDRFGKLKAQMGMLDNDDLLSRAADALRNPTHTDIRERYRDRFQLVMVDEFQDTNQMQVDMINLVAGGGKDELSRRMCVVGDAQQSIYRFRNADLAVFKDYVARVGRAQEQGNGRIVHLEQNFRSNGEVLAFCKGAFENTFGAGQDYLELLHGRNEDAARKRAPFQGAQGVQDPDPAVPRRINVIALNGGRAASDARTCAARIIARDFRRLCDAGHTPGQMAVLLGGMGHAQEYAQALAEQGLPCAIAGGSVFNRAPEVGVVEDLCFVLADPFDTQRLANVLTSPLFGLEAEDLLQLEPVRRTAPDAAAQQAGTGLGRRAGLVSLLPPLMGDTAADTETRVRAYAAQAGWSTRLTACLAALLPAAAEVGTKPLSALIERILADSGWLSRLTEDDQAVAGNVLKAVRIIRGIERDQHVDALSLAKRVQERIETLKEAPGVLAAAGSDFVRIMTIHASKGLQFPIVAVAETDGGSRQRGKLHTLAEGTRTRIALDAGFTLDRVRKTLADDCLGILKDNLFADDETDSQQLQAGLSSSDPAVYWTALNALDAAGDAEEYQRKLYVAYTRAEDCLFAVLNNSARNGLPEGAPREIGRQLAGDDGITFGESAHGMQLFRQDTFYDGHPECDISWIARLETVNTKADDFPQFMDELIPTDAQHADRKTAAGAARETALQPQETNAAAAGRRPFAIPTQTLPPQPQSYPYRLQWSEGLLSASALKHEAADEEDGGRTPQCLPNADVPYAEKPAAAVEKGTAFHSLGEFAAHAWRRTGRIALPPEGRMAALARLHGLDAAQTEDLHRELERWTASPVARQMEAHAHLDAEAPFFIPLAERGAEGGSPLTLYGFIDLLAYDRFGSGTAHVVDYKTGRSLKTDTDRRAAYEIQAKCYAYALLLQGFQDVDLDFVFVDQPDEGDPAIPQVTHFPAPGQPRYEREALRAQLEQTARAIV